MEDVMVVEPNMAKYEAYKSMHVDLKKAMGSSIYYQAIFIEYAIAEDRCRSALVFAGVKCVNNRGQELKLSAKINKLKSNSAFTAKYPRSRLTLELLDELTHGSRIVTLWCTTLQTYRITTTQCARWRNAEKS